MRIAILTDVHANLTALRSVLTDINARGPFHLIVSAGDQLSGGPRPIETWQELEQAGVMLLKGDTERDLGLAEFKPISGSDERQALILAVFDWTLDLVPSEIRDRAVKLPEELRIHLDGGSELLITHANSVNLDDLIWADTPPAELERLLGSRPPSLMVVGHIHAPLELEIKGSRILRPGSVGLKYEPRWRNVAHWADVRWEPDRRTWLYQVHEVTWDHKLEIETAYDVGYPGVSILPGFEAH